MFQLFRANRCVVDTGIHHLRWSREVERYCTSPGQACSYKLGHTVFTEIRARARAKAKAKAAKGAWFDLKAFHDTVLNCGRVPLDILQRVGDDWIAGRIA